MQALSKSLPEYPVVRAMGGVGNVLAPKLIAEIGDLHGQHAERLGEQLQGRQRHCDQDDVQRDAVLHAPRVCGRCGKHRSGVPCGGRLPGIGHSADP